MTILIIDYGMGNLRSVQKAFERINVEANISSNPKEVLNADKLLLPGIGHFENGVKNLKNSGLFDALNDAVLLKKIPILGICLGMQLMTVHSEEGDVNGFGWLNARTKHFTIYSNKMRIPHMGWNSLTFKKNDYLFNDSSFSDYFYFVHSYYVSTNDKDIILSETDYGIKFVSSFKKDNIYGCQFHPEKSHSAGLKILKNFMEI